MATTSLSSRANPYSIFSSPEIDIPNAGINNTGIHNTGFNNTGINNTGTHNNNNNSISYTETSPDKSLTLQMHDSEGKIINMEFTTDFVKLCLNYILLILGLNVLATSVGAIHYYESISSLCSDFKDEIKYIYICAILNIILTVLFGFLLLQIVSYTGANYKTSVSATVTILIILIILITFLNSFINYKYNVYLGFCSTKISTSDHIYLYYYNLASYTLGFPMCVCILMLLYIYLNKLKRN